MLETDLMRRFETADEIERLLDDNWNKFRRKSFIRRPDLIGAGVLRRLARRSRFKNKVVENRYNEKRERLRTAIALGTPDKVPIITSGLNFYPAYYSGTSMADYCNSMARCGDAFLKYCRENTRMDAIFPSQLCCQGPMITATGLDILMLPGVHLPENVGYQFVEKERLKPEEYEYLIGGGLDFFRQTILPRMTPYCCSVKGWDRKVLARIGLVGLTYGYFFSRTLDICEKQFGIPVSPGSFSFAPYDLVSFLFRGLTGISGDLFRNPEMVEQAADLMVDAGLFMSENVAASTGIREVVILCERAFSLSPKQFERFYMPSLKKLVISLLERGIVPLLALEGDCTHLLEFMLELPPQKCVIALDTSDVFEANRLFKGHICFTGNVPMNMMVLGTPKDIEEYCARLLEECAPGGGFIMAGALGIPDNANLENYRAMVEYTDEHGKY